MMIPTMQKRDWMTQQAGEEHINQMDDPFHTELAAYGELAVWQLKMIAVV